MFGFLQKVTDPVCKMKIDKKTEFLSDYQGSKYYFCSENCRKSFNEEPEKYVTQENIPAKSCCQQNTKSCC
ncbi:YHS domain-containing protein [Candidatus Daviesbacteria bacterium]|nr:YHS domain-containing protein [Candidatus Daviesbacteria bacterium]